MKNHNNDELAKSLINSIEKGDFEKTVLTVKKILNKNNKDLLKNIINHYKDKNCIQYNILKNSLYESSCYIKEDNMEGQLFFIPITLEQNNNSEIKSKELINLFSKDFPKDWNVSIVDRWVDMKKLENINFSDLNIIKNELMSHTTENNIINSDFLNNILESHYIQDENNFNTMGSDVISKQKDGKVYHTKISERGILGFIRYPEIDYSENSVSKTTILFNIISASPTLALSEEENLFLDDLSNIYNKALIGYPKTIQETLEDYKAYVAMQDLEVRIKQQYFNLGEKPLVYLYHDNNKFRLSITDQKAYILDEVEIPIKYIEFEKMEKIFTTIVYGVVKCEKEDDLPKFNRRMMN
jgi:hypothetical protein